MAVMIVSLNEIESLSYKAARGAGMSWGLAEEAAFATRWLAIRNANWSQLLLSLLERYAETAPPSLTDTEMHSTRPGAAVCPIHAGAAIADLLQITKCVTLYDVLSPVWLLPFGHRRTGVGADVNITWSTGACALRAAGTVELPMLTLPNRLDWLRIERCAFAQPSADVAAPPAMPQGVPADPAELAKIDAWAARTYVPASLQSRLAGAGAGLSDND
jgi:hypothetical protein